MLRLTFALAVLLFGKVARADKAISELEARATAAIREGHFVEALALYRAIWERDPTSTFAACNVGTLSYGTDDMPQAAQWLTLCLRLAKPPRNPLEERKHAAVVRDLARAKQRIATMIVYTDRPKAQVFVGGQPAQEGAPAFVNPGRVTVGAKDGGQVVTQDIDAHAGKAPYVVLLRFAVPAKVPPASGPIRPVPVPMPGSGVSTNYAVTIVTGASLTALFLAVGIGADINARKADTDSTAAEDACNRGFPAHCESSDAAKAAHRALIGLEIASFTLAGTLAVATVVYAVKARPKPPLVPGAVQW